MNTFEKYFLMKEKDVIRYVKEKTDFFTNSTAITVIEIGNGNLNYVFRVKDEKTNKTIIVKQAGEELRIDSNIKLPITRGKHEYDTYLEFQKILPDMTPKMYFYDEVMCVIVMEDMYGYEVMRDALLNQNLLFDFSNQITDYFVNLLYTTEFLNDKEKKQNINKFYNPHLCKITEDLVFSFPFEENKTNNVIEQNKEFVKKEVYDDCELKTRVGKLKYKFMNCTQALIHGDLHTGSLFIRENKVCIFDPEFSFYGPIGYDIGNLMANLFFAILYSHTIENLKGKDFCNSILNIMELIIEKFIQKFSNLYKKVYEKMFDIEGFQMYILGDILEDTAGYMGTEIIRRIVGMAKNRDVTIINDLDTRAKVERVGILVAKDCIINSQKYTNGKQYTELIDGMLKKR